MKVTLNIPLATIFDRQNQIEIAIQVHRFLKFKLLFPLQYL